MFKSHQVDVISQKANEKVSELATANAYQSDIFLTTR